jgi:uncharacterized protein with HEPN domain
MYDKELISDVLENILWALYQIENRFSTITHASDFMDSEEGLIRLDSICMQLINIGEALKQIDKITNKELLIRYTQIEWKKVMGMRDIITHHYFDIDAETVYSVCEDHVPTLKRVITNILNDVKK